MSPTPILEPAYILHGRKYRNTSLILDLLTRHQGRFSVVVRGASRSKSKLRGRLQPFTPLLVASVGRGELKTSTTIDFPARPFRIIGEKLLLGLYVNELLYRLLGRFDPHTELYDSYEALLDSLQGYAESVSSIRQFELILLQQLGYGINFDYEALTGDPVEPGHYYRYVVHEGFHRVSEPSAEAYQGDELLNIGQGMLEQVDRQRLLNLTRKSLAELLGDKPLKSRSLFKGVSR